MARRPKTPAQTFDCPHCGAAVRAGAAACRECGSDVATGWADDAELDLGSIPLGDDDFDYEAWLAAELGEGDGAAARRARRVRWMAGLVVLAMLLWLFLR